MDEIYCRKITTLHTGWGKTRIGRFRNRSREQDTCVTYVNALNTLNSLDIPTAKKDAFKLENFQTQATKLLTTVEQLFWDEKMSILNWESLEKVSLSEMIEAYKIVSNIEVGGGVAVSSPTAYKQRPWSKSGWSHVRKQQKPTAYKTGHNYI